MTEQPDGPARDRAARAIARAYSLPTNLQDALDEHAHWERRDRELQLLLGPGDRESRLDLTAHLRQELIRNLIQSELPVHGKVEFQIRLQFWMDECQEKIGLTTPDEVMRLAEMAGRDLGRVILRNSDATAALFAQRLCDVMVPSLQLADRGHTASERAFDSMLSDAIRAELTELKPRHRG